MNYFSIVGVLAEKPEYTEIIGADETKKELTIFLAVPRDFKNENGDYETDFLNVKVDKKFVNTIVEYCEKGDIIGVSGYIEAGKILYATKITFLSSKKD